MPNIITDLHNYADIHFYGPCSTEIHNPQLRDMLQMHELPYKWDRSRASEKITKTILWYLFLPAIGLHCRAKGIQIIWNDETIPFTACILRFFYGHNIALTVMDFFARIYTEKHPKFRWLSNLVERIDFASWRKLPLIFTKVIYTQKYLAQHGVPQKSMHLYRNPVDHSKFHPVDKATRQTTRAKFGIQDTDLVLSHHGILHPNKGNDWVLHRIAELKNDIPNLKFLLIGNGPEMGNLIKLAAHLGISNHIIFTGWLSSETELNNALASTDIGLVIRIGQETDHFHMTDTLAHEMACEKPILAVRLHGISEVIQDGDNGLLFSIDHPAEFNKKLALLLTNPEERGRLGKASLQTSQNICKITPIAQSISNLLRTSI